MPSDFTVEELEAAIKKLKSGKAPGRDNINSVNTINKHNVGCVFEINTDFFQNFFFYLVICINVITDNKLHDTDCYHIILYSIHNSLAKT